MRFLPLVWAALWRNRTESVLTLLALSVGFALLGAMIALFDGREIWIWGAFKLYVSPSLWVLGLVSALITSLLGGVFPALRAARLPAVEALRAA